jgi:hypothetical protein
MCTNRPLQQVEGEVNTIDEEHTTVNSVMAEWRRGIAAGILLLMAVTLTWTSDV